MSIFCLAQNYSCVRIKDMTWEIKEHD
jgi:hypothetical protein